MGIFNINTMAEKVFESNRD